MATYRVKSPDGAEWDINAPEDADEAAVMRYPQAQWKSKSKKADYNPISPTDDMSFGEQALAGAGKALS